MAYATPKETALLDTPIMPHGSFNGYYRKKDATLLPLNVLTYPTTNVFMPDGDKIVPRKGVKVLGQDATQNSGIIGHAKKYKNRAGIEMEVRVWTDNTITLSGISGTFQVGEVVYGDFGDATIVSIDGNVLTVAWNPDSAYRFESGVVTGLSSGATGTLEILRGDVIEVFYDGLWRQITLNQNPLTSSLHEYYFTQWMDTNIDNSISANSNRLIWVMGRNLIRSWTGGIAVVNTVNPGVSIAIQNVTWNEIGFIPPAQGGTEFITINGKEYEATGGWNTGILTLTDTTGISPGDLVFQGIQEKEWFNDFDVVSSFKNYPVYGNWKLQKVFIGNNFNHPSSENIVTSNALQNDLIIDSTANYTGTGSHIYKVTITDVNPEFENSRFYGGGEGSLNDGWWITSGYTGSAGVTNNYKISIVGNATIGLTSGVGFSVGDIVSQSSTGSMAVIIAKYYLVGPAYNVIALRMLTNTAFDVSVAVTNLSTSATEIPIVSNAQNWIQASKNGVQIAVQTDPIFGVVNIPPLQYSVSLGASGDNLSIQFSNYLGHAIGDVFELTINKGGNDTFQYQIDNGAPVTGIAITGGAQSLSSGVVIKFNSKTGHSIGDYWDIQVDQAVTNAYANFYYTTPVRKPGEGYIGNLPANFWAMAPQEDNMYINDALGKWGYLDTELSSDLTSEVIKYVPLKNATQNKVIYPYMIGYSDNEILFVTEDKRLDMIGRKKFVELPQVGYLSDDVKYDFLEASFTKGSIEFTDMRIFITSPYELKMFCYDLAMKYWQPPQLIQENAMLSIIGNDLISHSNLNNVTNTLFVGTNDNGSAFPIIIRTGYNQYGNRWRCKRANSLFVEGYMQGNPILDVNYLLDVNGCAGIVKAEVDPVYCIAPDNAPIGAGTLGSHSLGSDQPSPIPYFRWIGIGQTPFDFYLGAFDLRTETKDPQFEILTLGTNAIYSMKNNSTLKRGQLKII